MMYIQSQLLKSYKNDFIIHKPQGDLDGSHKHLIALLTELTDKPILVAYNLGNNHWVAIAALKDADKITLLYKDSLYSVDMLNNFNIVSIVSAVENYDKNIKTYFNLIKTQTDEASCGIFVLKNLQIMAEQITANKLEFINNFSKFRGFCTQNQANELRADSFPKFYKLGEKEAEEIEETKLKIRSEIRQHHEKELEKVNEILQECLKKAESRIQEKAELCIESFEFGDTEYNYYYLMPKGVNSSYITDLSNRISWYNNKIMIKPKNLKCKMSEKIPLTELVSKFCTLEIKSDGNNNIASNEWTPFCLEGSSSNEEEAHNYKTAATLITQQNTSPSRSDDEDYQPWDPENTSTNLIGLDS